MTDASDVILLSIAYLLIKHAVADFFLQTPFQYRNKGTYGHPGGLLHCAIHLVLTIPVFLIAAPSGLQLVVVILIGEFVLHYHVDWCKELAVKHYDWTPEKAAFWRAMGIDQLAHGLTYVAITWALLAF
jgi:hypothetical protein